MSSIGICGAGDAEGATGMTMALGIGGMPEMDPGVPAGVWRGPVMYSYAVNGRRS